jgi:hypothetical protein
MLGVWDDDVCLSCWDTNYGDKEIHFHSFTLTLYSAYLEYNLPEVPHVDIYDRR